MKIGIFWINNGSIYTKSDLSHKHVSEDGISDLPIGHYEYWSILQQQNRDFLNVGYDEIPRGRVIQQKETFIIYSSRSLLASSANRKMIEKAFEKEALDNVVFKTDEHYENVRQLGFEEFEYSDDINTDK